MITFQPGNIINMCNQGDPIIDTKYISNHHSLTLLNYNLILLFSQNIWIPPLLLIQFSHDVFDNLFFNLFAKPIRNSIMKMKDFDNVFQNIAKCPHHLDSRGSNCIPEILIGIRIRSKAAFPEAVEKNLDDWLKQLE